MCSTDSVGINRSRKGKGNKLSGAATVGVIYGEGNTISTNTTMNAIV
jgi:hypothetical protein